MPERSKHRTPAAAELAAFPWTILLLALLAQTSLALVGQAIPTLVPFLQADFALTRAQVGLFVTAAQLGNASSQILGGWVADYGGPRRIMALGQAVEGLAFLALAQADPWLFALPAAFLAGIGWGMGSPANTLAILQWFPARSRGTAMGVKQTGVPIGGFISATTLPPLALAVGWRPALALCGAAVLVAAGFSLWVYRDRPLRPRVASRRAGGLGRLLGLLANRDLLLVSAFAAALVAAQVCALAYLMLYLKETIRLPLVVGGWMLALMQLGALTGRIGWGLVSDRLLGGNRKAILCATGGGAAVVLSLVGLAGENTPLWAVPLLAFALGLSVLGWHGIHQTLVAELVGAEVAGTAVGISMTLLQVGPTFGPPLFGYTVDATGSYRPAWLGLGVVAGLITAAIAAFLRERKRM